MACTGCFTSTAQKWRALAASRPRGHVSSVGPCFIDSAKSELLNLKMWRSNSLTVLHLWPAASLRSWLCTTGSLRRTGASSGRTKYDHEAMLNAGGLCRRSVLLAVLSSVFFQGRPAFSIEGGGDEGFVEFRSPKNKYRVARPAAWEQTSKAGADVLFQDPGQKSTNVGITVSPIRINSLDQFGDVTSVGEKLLATERNKESTLEAQLLHEGSRVGPSGTLIYDFDYSLNTTRGAKRVLSSVAIADKKLFIVNGTVKCAAGQCSSDTDEAVQLLAQVAKSFDVEQ